MAKKKTIGSNPLMAYLSKEQQRQKAQPNLSAKAPKQQEAPSKQRVTIHLSTDLINRVKDAVYWEPGLTLTSFAQQALSKALDKLEKKRGQKYPARKDHNLRGGRPLG